MLVRRHVVTCRTYAAGPLTTATLRDALGRPFEERLADSLSWAGPGGGYWLVRRLELRATVGSGWGAEQVGAAVARSLGTRLGVLVEGRGDAENLLWFPDRASFLARYLLDLTDGRSTGRWEYAQFGTGETDRVLVDLAAEEPDEVLDALLLLGPRERHRVLAALPRAREDELATLLAPGSSTPTRRDLVAHTVQELRSSGLLRSTGTALLLALAAAGGSRREAFASALAPAREVADLLGLLEATGSRTSEVLGLLASGDWPGTLAVVGTASADVVLPFVDWSQSERVALADALDTTARTDAAGADQLRTSFGGAFLLLQVLDGLCAWDAATRGWPPLGDVAAARLVRLLVLSAALGRGRSADAVHDEVLRMVLGVPPSLDGHALGEWVSGVEQSQVDEFLTVVRGGVPSRVDPATSLVLPGASGPAARLVGQVAGAVLSSFGARLPGMGAASASYLVENLLDLEAWVTLDGHSAVVELGHPPLDVLLMLSGLNRGDFRFAGSEVTWTLTARP